MSQRYVDAVWRSPAPAYLKAGVLGALAAWARDDGTFLHPATRKRLRAHVYFAGPLSERTVQTQLRTLERFGIITAPPHRGGRERERAYRLHLTAILALSPGLVAAAAATRAARRRVGNDALKGATNYATEAAKGCNKLCNGADPLYVREKEKNVRTEQQEPWRAPTPPDRTPTAPDPRVATPARLAAVREAFTPAAVAAAEHRANARRIAKVLRGLAEARRRPAWLDYGDVKDGLRRELKRLRLSYQPAELDDAVSWLSSNVRLVARPPLEASR